LVDERAPRVVDARDHVLDPEVLAGDARGEDVGVVTVGHCGERARALDAGLDEVVAVEAEADDRAAREAAGQATERPRVLVDDGDGVPRLLERLREFGTHSTTPHDDDVHGASSGTRGC
jgi:hypothetical protein